MEELPKPPCDPPLKRCSSTGWPPDGAAHLPTVAGSPFSPIICLWSKNPEETREGQKSSGVLQTIDSQRDAKMAESQLRADGKITAMHHSRSQFSNVKFNLLGLPLPDRWKRSPFESETAGL